MLMWILGQHPANTHQMRAAWVRKTVSLERFSFSQSIQFHHGRSDFWDIRANIQASGWQNRFLGGLRVRGNTSMGVEGGWEEKEREREGSQQQSGTHEVISGKRRDSMPRFHTIHNTLTDALSLSMKKKTGVLMMHKREDVRETVLNSCGNANFYV